MPVALDDLDVRLVPEELGGGGCEVAVDLDRDEGRVGMATRDEPGRADAAPRPDLREPPSRERRGEDGEEAPHLRERRVREARALCELVRAGDELREVSRA